MRDASHAGCVACFNHFAKLFDLFGGLLKIEGDEFGQIRRIAFGEFIQAIHIHGWQVVHRCVGVGHNAGGVRGRIVGWRHHVERGFRGPTLDDGAHFFGAHGFGKIIIHARAETFLAVTGHRAGGHCYDDHRRFEMTMSGAISLTLTNLSCRIQSIHLRHHHVHEDEIERCGFDGVECFDAVACDGWGVTHLTEYARGNFLIDEIVVAQQHA